jgi:hypothetical protein
VYDEIAKEVLGSMVDLPSPDDLCPRPSSMRAGVSEIVEVGGRGWRE